MEGSSNERCHSKMFSESRHFKLRFFSVLDGTKLRLRSLGAQHCALAENPAFADVEAGNITKPMDPSSGF